MVILVQGQLDAWLKEEMEAFSGVLSQFQKKQRKKAPLWMAGSVLVLVAIGFLAGYDVGYILKVHLPIGCGIALFAGLCFWIPSKVSNIKKVQKAYEAAMTDFFQTDEEKERFVQQMQAGQYDAVNFLNVNQESYPSRLLVGPEYWVYFSRFCQIIRTSDIESICGKEETTRVSYTAGNTRVRQKLAVGVSLVLTYREGSDSALQHKDGTQSLFFQKSEQYKQALDLIRKQCPRYADWTGKNT